MSGEDMTNKQWIQHLTNKTDKLVEAVSVLENELKDWRIQLREEFSEFTAILVEHFQQVVDKHLLNKQVDDYFDGQTVDSPSSAEESDSTIVSSVDNRTDNSSQTDGPTATHTVADRSKDGDQWLTSDTLESEVD